MNHPYRAQSAEPGERLRIHPGVAPRLVILIVVLIAAPALLHVFLWSRVVTVACDKADRHVTCAVRDESLGGGGLTKVELDEPARARLEGALDSTRGDAWIEVVLPTSSVRLTEGFNLAKTDQARIAAALTVFFHDGSPRFVGGYGSRWGTAPVPLLGLAVALFYYAVFGVRLTLVRRQRLGTLEVELRRWPAPARHLGFELRDIRGVEVGGDPTSRIALHKQGPNLMLRLASGELVRLAFATPGRARALRDRVAAFVQRPR